LAADVAGYSRLMGADEVGTLAALKALRRDIVDPAIGDHKGRIVKTTGDGLLVEFASAVDAVTCAITVQGLMAQRNKDAPKITFRVGINVGDIIIDGDDIFGDGVNVAARVEAECEPGGVCLSEDAFRQVRDKTTYTFEDLGEKALKNIERPVRLYAIRPDGSSPAPAKPRTDVPLALPDKPSIAVLPFQNMSGDPKQDYFADGMVEDIITALSRFKSLFVIARNSSFTYKGKSIDVKQVGRELGVRYVLEGSVRRVGEKVRITAQLIDVSTGTHLWADRFDGSLSDVFEMQDNVSASVVGAIAPRLDKVSFENVSKKRVDSWGAYDFYLRGMKLWWDAQTNGSANTTLEALQMFRKAVLLDPAFGRACARVGGCLESLRDIHGLPLSEDEHAEALSMAEQAVQSAGDDEVALTNVCYVVGFLGDDYERAAQLADRALTLNPNLSHAWNARGIMRVVLGEHEPALGDFAKAIRLNPVDNVAVPLSLFGLAAACLLLARYEDSESWSRKLIALVPNDIRGWYILVGSTSLAGKADDASDAIARFEKLFPYMRSSIMRRTYRVRRPSDMAVVERVIAALGLPD
jgi:TolB-like protein/class 3 adenylate cyclase/tetratricopeptide (TPR) repeat protein